MPESMDPVGGRVAVKICGVTEPADALLSAELGAGYLGLNFWPGSPRCIDLRRAHEIAAAVRARPRSAPRVALVGVFVNPTPAAVEDAAAAVGLDLLQFSGDEPPDAVRPFAARAIKALRTHDLGAAAAYAGCWGVLFDAPRAGAAAGDPGAAGAAVGDPGAASAAAPEYGGTGRQWDHAGAPEYGGTGRQWDYAAAAGAIAGAGCAGAGFARVFIAGGLGPGNVRRVIATLRPVAPFAVDVCSGVESAPGRKDPRLLRQLFEEVRNGQVTSPA
jgi:phosphoribosylanthranilate isomerase